MKVLKHLFENNREWAAKQLQKDPDFFKRLSRQQKPGYLWIGCSDSRVPANEIIGLPPGEVFVHRNVANLIIENDLNCQSVIQFAVNALKIKHIIVCGHYGCGGVNAAMNDMKIGLADEWIKHIKSIQMKFSNMLLNIKDDSKRFAALCRLNVIEQVLNVCNTNTIKQAWEKGQKISVHGWIYDVSDGLLQDLDVCVTNLSEIKSLDESTFIRMMK